DRQGWEPLWAGYNTFYGRTLPASLIDQTWHRLLDPAEAMFALVAARPGELLGLVHYLFHRSTTLTSDICYLQDLFTAEAARGQGVAAGLIAAVCDRARAAGSERVYWHTHETNATARRLYDRVAERPGFLMYRVNL